MREIAARVFDAFITHHDRSPRKSSDHLAELGYYGRGGERYNDSTVIGWRKGEYAPSAWVFIAAILDVGLSFDELAYGWGLRAEVERLSEKLATNEPDVQLLAGIVTRHLELDPAAAQDVGRIGRRDVEPA